LLASLVVMRKTQNVNRNVVKLCLMLLVVTGCVTEMPVEADSDLEIFNEFIGESKAHTLDLTVKSYGDFLKVNYPDLDESTAISAFLTDIRDQFPNTPLNWTLATEENMTIVQQAESTGLRKEIWIADNEEYDYAQEYDLEEDTSNDSYIQMEDIKEEIIPIVYTNLDSAELEKRKKRSTEIRHFHTYGKYLQGLKELNSTDSSILGYINVKEMAGNISPALIAEGLLESTTKEGFSDPIIKRIVVVELYLKLLIGDS